MRSGMLAGMTLTIAATVGFAIPSFADPNLSPGDVAIVQVQGSGDSFSFVALKPIPDGTVLSWTDEGWLAAGGFNGNGTGEQGFNAISTTGGIAAGTVTTIPIPSGLGASGESVYLFEGTAPTSNPGAGLLWGINWGKSPAAWDADGATSSTSSLAPAVANDNLALGAPGGWIYSGPMSGSQSALISDIQNPGNWSTQATGSWTPGTNFTVVAAPEPSSLAMGAAAIGSALCMRRRRRS